MANIMVVYKFQSLIHQVSVSFTHKDIGITRDEQFQSLIHQVSVSFIIKDTLIRTRSILVSIPYSSGQCFFYSARPAGEKHE